MQSLKLRTCCQIVNGPASSPLRRRGQAAMRQQGMPAATSASDARDEVRSS